LRQTARAPRLLAKKFKLALDGVCQSGLRESMMPTMDSIFPTSIAKKYAAQSAGNARLLTYDQQGCRLTRPKWTEKEGGYYTDCNKKLSQQ